MAQIFTISDACKITNNICNSLSLSLNENQKKDLSSHLFENPVLALTISKEITATPSKNKLEAWRQKNDLYIHLEVLSHQIGEEHLQQILKNVVAQKKKANELTFSHIHPLDELKAFLAPGKRTYTSLLMQASASKELSEKTFGHIHAETLLENSSFAGNYTKDVIAYLNAFLQDYHPPFENSVGYQNFKKAIALQNQFYQEIGNPPTAESYIQTFTKFLNNLAPSEFFLINSGWVNHSMQMLIQKKESDALGKELFDVLLFNLGMGAEEWHIQGSNDEMIAEQSYFLKENVSKSSFESQYFPRAHFELKYHTHELKDDLSDDDEDEEEQVKPTDYSPKDLYSLCTYQLDGTVSQNIDQKNILRYQIGPICTWASLVCVGNYFMEKSEFSITYFDISLHSLLSFYAKNKDIPISKDVLQLMRHAGISFAGLVYESFKGNVIDQAKLGVMHDTLVEYFEFIEEKELQLQRTDTPNSEIPKTAQNTIKNPEYVFFKEKKELENEIQRFAALPQIAPHFLESPINVISQLTQINSYINACKNSGDASFTPKLIWKITTALFRSLPLPNETELWTKFDETTAKETIVLLQAILENNLSFLETTATRNTVKKQLCLYFFQGLLIAHALSKTIPELKDMQGILPILYFTENYLAIVHPANNKGHCTYYNPYDRKIAFKGLKYYRDLTRQNSSHANLFIVSNSLERNAPPISCFNIPKLDADTFKRWLSTSNAPGEAAAVFSYLENPAIQKKLLETYPHLRTKNSQTRFCYLISDIEGNILPGCHYAYRDMATQLRFLSASLSLEEADEEGAKESLATPKYFTFEEAEQHISLKVKFTVGDEEEEEEQSSHPFCQLSYDASQLEFRDNDPSKIYEISRHFQYASALNEAFILSPKFDSFIAQLDFTNSSEDEIRELCEVMALGNMDNQMLATETQTLKVLAYFKANNHKLNDPILREIFVLLLFENTFLENTIRSSHLFGNIFQDFIEERIHYSFEEKNINALCFFLQIGRIAENIMHVTYGNASVRYSNYFAWILKALSLKDLTITQQNELNKVLLAEFIANSSLHSEPDFVQKAINAYFNYTSQRDNADDRSDFFCSEYIKLNLSLAYCSLEPFVTKLLANRETANNLCNAITESRYLHAPKDLQWDCSNYPLCTSFDKTYTINFYLGYCFEGDTISVVLDKKFFDSSLQTKLVDKPFYPARMNKQGSYYVKFKGQELIIKNYSNHFKYFLKENNNIYSLLSTWDTVALSKLEIISPFKIYIEKKTLWVRKIDNDNVEFSLKDDELRTTHLFLGRMQKKDYVIENVVLLKEDHERLEMIPQGEAHHLLKDIYPTSLLSRCIIWKNALQQPTQLDIPVMALSFSLEKHGNHFIAHSDQFPSFFLSYSQNIRGIGFHPHIVILENEKGVKKALLIKGEIKPKTKGAFGIDYDVNKKEDQKENAKNYYIYEIDPDRGLTTTDKELKLYWAYHLLALKEYHEVYAILQQAAPRLIKYTFEEAKLLETIAHACIEWKDTTSGAAAIGLFAMLQYIRSLNGEEISQSTQFYLTALYHRYVNRINYAPIFKLKATDIDYANSLLGIKSYQTSILPYFQAAPDNLNFNRNRILFTNTQRPSKGSQEDFINLYKKMGPLLNGKIVAPPGLISRPAKYFQSHFLYFYEKAKSKNREILSDIVFARHGGNKIKSFYSELLLTVYHHPNRFPTPEALLKCLQKKNWDIFNQIILTPYEELKTKTLIDAAQAIHQQHIPLLPPSEITEESSSSAMDIERTSSKRKLGEIDAKSGAKKVKKAKIATPEIEWKSFFNDTEVKSTFSLAPRNNETLTPEQLADALETAEVNIIPKESARLREEINAYWTSPDRKKPWQIIPDDKLEKTSLQLSVLKTEMKKRFNVAHKQLMNDIESLPSELQDAVLIGVQRQAQVYKQPTLEELTIFVARENNRFLRNLPPSFKDKEHEIRHKIIQVQSQQIRIQQLERAEDSLKELEKLSSKGIQEDDIAYRFASEKLHYELTRVPPYNPYTHPHLLCLEVLDSTGIYDWQHNDIDRIVNPQEGDSKNIVLQKNMGSGKSAIYRRLLAFLLAKDGQVPFVIVHSSLEGSSKKTIEEQSDVLEQFSYTFDFSRKHQSVAKLKEVFQQLKDAQENEGFFVVTDTTLYELKQCYKENLLIFLQQSTSTLEAEEKLQLHIDIEKFMRTYCPSIWDEFDLLANIRFESIYTRGDPVDLSMLNREVVADIFQCIYPDKELAGIFKAKNFTEEDYHSDLKNRIIQKYLNSSSASRILLKSHVDDTTLEKFLQGNEEAEKTVKNLPLDTNIRDLLHILHEEFNNLFHLTVSKKHDVDYMESPDMNKIFPCPGLACKVPNLSADFGFIYALLNYTMHTLVFEGVTSKLLYKLISGMQKAANHELQQDPAMRLEHTKGYKDFIELCGNNSEVAFFQITRAELEPLAAKLPHDIDFLCSFAKKFIFPFASYYVNTIVSPSYSILRPFLRIIGLTGTPWDHETYLENIKTIFDPSVTAKTTGLLIKNSEVFEIDDIEDDEKGPENTIKALVAIGNTHEHAPFDDWIDAEAFLKVGNLLEGAKLLLEHLPPRKKGVVFYHDNVEKVLERGSNTPIPLEKCKLPLEELHILFDDWHTTGANIKSAHVSCAYLTMGKMVRRKLEQSFGRKRESHLRQKVVLIIKKSYGAYVRKLLQLPEGTVIKPKHILKVCQYITETEINERLVSSAEKKLDDVIEEAIFNAINMYGDNPLPLLKESKQALTAIILKETKDEPHKTMGPVNQECNHAIYFQNHIQKLLNKCVSLSDNPLFAALTLMHLEDSLNDTISHCIIPEPIPRSHFSRAQQLVQQQSQQQSQAQVMQEVGVNNRSSSELSIYNSHRNWNMKLSPSNHFDTFFVTIPPKSLENTTYDNPPLLNTKDVMEQHQHLAPFAHAFSGIELSSNFVAKNFVLFEKNQYKAKTALLKYDFKNKTSSLVLITEADRSYFFHQLARDRIELHNLNCNRASDQQLFFNNELILFDYKLGVVQANHFYPLNLQPYLKQLLISRFMFGEMIFTKYELEILGEWLKENNPKQMEIFFYQHILYANENSNANESLKQKYPGSLLHKLFITLIQEQSKA